MFERVQAYNPAAAQSRAAERRRDEIRRSMETAHGGPRVIKDEFDATQPPEAVNNAEKDRGLPHTQTQEDADDHAGLAEPGHSGVEGVESRPRLDVEA